MADDFPLLDQRLELVDPSTLEPHPDNPNEGDVGLISELVDANGFYGAIIAQTSRRRIIAGEHRWRAALARGAEHLPVLWVDVDDDRALRMLLGDNEAGRKSRNDPSKLAELLAEMEHSSAGLAGTGFDHDDLGALLEDLRALEPSEPKQVNFEAWNGVKPKQPTTEWGDVWLIGPHRVICGDSLDGSYVDRLLEGIPAQVVVADPPYAIYGSASGIASDIADDAMVRPFFKAMWVAFHSALEEFGHAYVCCDWRSYPALRECSKGTGMEPKNAIVWDKGGAGLGSNYANTYELIAFHAKIPPSGAMTASRKAGQRSVYASNIVRHNRPTGEDRQHNAAKPVEMLRGFIAHSSDPGGRVLDLFAGSGSTGLAAAAEGRVALLAEKDPAMVDVIVARMVKATGFTAEKETLAQV